MTNNGAVIYLRLPPSLKRSLQAVTRERGMSLNTFVQRCLEDVVAEELRVAQAGTRAVHTRGAA